MGGACTISVAPVLLVAAVLTVLSSSLSTTEHSAKSNPEEGWTQSCLQKAQRTPEPYTPEYLHTGGRVDTGGVEWAAYEYQGNITWEDLQKTSGLTHLGLPMYKILNGRLYYRAEDARWISSRDRLFLEQVLIALEWFDIPDMDFRYNQVDINRYPGGAIFQNCANNATGSTYDGFSVPYFTVIKSSVGPTQMKVLRKCLSERYPVEKRIQKIVWRGTSRYCFGVRDRSLGYVRALIVTALAKHKQISDCEITRFFKGPNGKDCRLWASITKNGSCPAPEPGLPMEDYNKYAYVMDVDGRAWSSRFVNLMLGNTPILKQMSRYPDYLTKHFINEDFLEFFDSDTFNVVERVKDVLSHRSKAPLEYHAGKVRAMEEFAETHLTHFGVARAMAYALTVYADKITWKPIMEEGYVDALELIEGFSNPSLPHEFVRRIKSKFRQ